MRGGIDDREIGRAGVARYNRITLAINTDRRGFIEARSANVSRSSPIEKAKRIHFHSESIAIATRGLLPGLKCC